MRPPTNVVLGGGLALPEGEPAHEPEQEAQQAQVKKRLQNERREEIRSSACCSCSS